MEEFSELKSARLLSIYARLLNGRLLKKALLAQEFGVTARSIQRDLESLRSFLSSEMLPQDVVYDRAAGGYRLTHARPMGLSNSEILAVCKILLESRSMRRDEMLPILDKLVDCCVPEENKRAVQQMIGNEKLHYINCAVFNHLQQTLETAFGKWFSIFHVQHIKALCALALFYKLCKQRGRYRNIPDCGRGLEGVADGRLRVCEQRIVPHMNHTRRKINVRPHQPTKLSAPHTGLKRQQAEKICPRPSCRVQKALRLFSGEWDFFLRCLTADSQGCRDRRFCNQVVIHGCIKNPAKHLYHLIIQALAHFGYRRNDKLNLYLIDLFERHVPQIRINVIVQRIFNSKQRVLPKIRHLIDAKPERGIFSKSRIVGNVKTRSNLCQ